MSRKTNSGRRGFTLIELMVAVALSLIIMLVAVTAFTQAAGVTSLAHARTEAMHNAQIALDFLEKDLEAAVMNAEGSLFVATHDGTMGGETLEFLTVSGQAGVVGCQHVKYYPTTRSGEVGSRLIRLTQACGDILPITAIAVFPTATAEKSSMVAYGVRAMNIRYFCKGIWSNEWNSTVDDPDGPDDILGNADDNLYYRRLPQVVEISLALTDSNGVLNNPDNPIKVRRLVTLPSSQ